MLKRTEVKTKDSETEREVRARSRAISHLKEGTKSGENAQRCQDGLHRRITCPQNGPWRSTPAGYSLSIQKTFLRAARSGARENVYVLTFAELVTTGFIYELREKCVHTRQIAEEKSVCVFFFKHE